MIVIAISAISSGFISWFFLFILVPTLRSFLLDKPNSRSSHSEPTPRGGGLSFVFISVLISFLPILGDQVSTFRFLPLFCLPVAIVGFLDDIYSLPALFRYCVQLLTAVFVIFYSPIAASLFFDISSNYLTPLFFLLLLLVVTSVINFVNFMDGLDGLIAGCMVVSIASLSVFLFAPWLLWGLVGPLIGFLFWNWSPAKVFMGDVGSTFLGAVFAGLVLQAASWTEALGFLLLGTPLLADAFFCVLRRLLAGQRVFQAHRLHLFQRLHQAGWTHARVSLTYVLATAGLALAMFIGGFACLSSLAAVELLLGVWLDQRVAVPFAVASQS